MRSAFGTMSVAILLMSCANPSPVSPSAEPSITPGPTVEPSTLPFGDPEDAADLSVPGAPVLATGGPNADTAFQPVSSALVHGVPYRFSLGHCGLGSPVDVDGSFWDEVSGTDPDGRPLRFDASAEMINQTPGVLIVLGDAAFFRTESGAVVTFARHVGNKGFPPCM